MANDYHIRVELHGVQQSEERQVYADLHEVMRTHGFDREIIAESGASYHLPRAEYVKLSSRSTREILNEVQAIVPLAWGGKFSAMAIQSAECWFVGLDPVNTTLARLGSLANPYLRT